MARRTFGDRSVVQKCRSQASIRSVVQLDVSFGSVGQKYRSEVSTEVLLGSVDQKCCSEVSIRSVEQEVLLRRVPQKCCGSEALLRSRTVDQIRSVDQACCSVNQKCGSEVSLKSVAQKCQSKCCSEVSLRSVEQNCRSEVSITREVSIASVLNKCCSGVSLIAQRRRPEVSLRSVAHVAEICVFKCCSNCPSGSSVADCVWLRPVAQKCFESVAQECRAVLPRSVVQRCRSEVSLKSVAYMCVCVCSEVLIGSRSEVLLRTVEQRCRSGVSISSVESDVLLKSIARCSAVWIRSVDQKVSTKSVDQKCCSEVSMSSVDQKC